MKIAIVVPFIHEGGGVPAVARYLCDILSDYDYQIISIATAKNDALSVRLFSPRSWLSGVKSSRSKWEGRDVIDVGAFLSEFEFQRYMPRLKLTELLNSFDIVQIVAGTPAVANIAKNVTKPVFLQVATLVKEERNLVIKSSSGIKKWYLKFITHITSIIEKKALNQADLVFVENLWMKSYLDQNFGPEKSIIAIPGVDDRKFIPSNDRPNSTDFGAAGYVVSVGRFSDKRKNVPLLFHAYKRLRDSSEYPPTLVLAGINPPSDTDWQLAETLQIKKHVIFRENISATELVILLQNAQCFICSSDEEGLGIAMLEALACATPVVSTACGGPEIFIEDGVNGFLVPRNDASTLAESVHKLISSDELLIRMRTQARKSIEEKFSKEATKSIFIEAYRELA